MRSPGYPHFYHLGYKFSGFYDPFWFSSSVEWLTKLREALYLQLPFYYKTGKRTCKMNTHIGPSPGEWEGVTQLLCLLLLESRCVHQPGSSPSLLASFVTIIIIFFCNQGFIMWTWLIQSLTSDWTQSPVPLPFPEVRGGGWNSNLVILWLAFLTLVWMLKLSPGPILSHLVSINSGVAS